MKMQQFHPFCLRFLTAGIVVALSTISLQARAGATLTDDSFISSKTVTKTNGAQPALALSNTTGNTQTGLLKFNLDGSDWLQLCIYAD